VENFNKSKALFKININFVNSENGHRPRKNYEVVATTTVGGYGVWNLISPYK